MDPDLTPFFIDFKDAKKNQIFFLKLTHWHIVFGLKIFIFY
jgi:hypothetical protein